MTYSFNLIDQPWIPCTMPDGSHAELSLQDTLLQAHEIREIFDQSPLVTAALHRLLLAILHRNFGPASRSEWQTLWQAQQFDSIQLGSYFSQWHDRFDLFDGEYPFYQVVGLKDESEKPKNTRKIKEVEANDLLPELARGNTSTLFDHTIDEDSPSLSPPEAARKILALQSYKLGGLSGLASNYVDAPIARAVCFLVGGETLFETLLLNLVPYHGDEPIPAVVDNDLPVWEQDKTATSGIPRGYLDYLTWQTLSVLFASNADFGSRMRVSKFYGFGLDSDVNSSVAKSSTLPVRTKRIPKPGRNRTPGLSHATSRIAPYGETAFRFFASPMKNKRPPSALKWMSQLIDSGILDRRQLRTGWLPTASVPIRQTSSFGGSNTSRFRRSTSRMKTSLGTLEDCSQEY